MAKQKKKRKYAQKIKLGVKMCWDPVLKRWVRCPGEDIVYSPPDQMTPLDKQLYKIVLKYPLSSGFVITQTFQEHQQTKQEKGYKYYNGGLDLAFPDVREGDPVYAAAPGVVIRAKYDDTGYGNYVQVENLDGFTTIYAHLRSWAVKEGQTVSTSDIIGFLGHTGNCWGGPGNSNGTHLHFELRHLKIPIDPMPYLPVHY